MGHHGSGQCPACEPHGSGAPAGLIGVDDNVVMLCDAAGLFPEPADALPDLPDLFPRAWSRQALGQRRESLPEAPGEVFDNSPFLCRTCLGEAVQTDVPTVTFPLQTDPPARGGLQADGRVRVECPFPAHHEPAVSLILQPLNAVFGGRTTVHHHRCLLRHIRCREHFSRSVVFTDIACKDPGNGAQSRFRPGPVPA